RTHPFPKTGGPRLRRGGHRLADLGIRESMRGAGPARLKLPRQGNHREAHRRDRGSRRTRSRPAVESYAGFARLRARALAAAAGMDRGQKLTIVAIVVMLMAWMAILIAARGAGLI